jgi:hypothetical protein
MDLVQRALGGLPMTVVFATAAKVCVSFLSSFFNFSGFFMLLSLSRIGSIHALPLNFAVLSLSSKQADNDPHRKPGRGMWDLFVSQLASSSSSGG